MRNDCVICPFTKIRLPQIPAFSPGRKHEAERGDIIRWKVSEDATSEEIGRVIGSVTALDLDCHWLCVAHMSSYGTCSESWVHPDRVTDCHSMNKYSYDKLKWLFGDTFLETPPDLARRCYDLPIEKLLEQNREQNASSV